MLKTTIVLADDHPIATAGIRHALARHSNYEILADARSSDELVELISKLRPDVVITDYNMPGSVHFGDGLRMIAYLRRTFPDVRIVVFTMISSASVATSLYKLGVAAVVVKTGSLEDLNRSLNKILAAPAPRGPLVAAVSADTDADGGANTDILGKLTRKELEVLRELFSGVSVSEIAKRQQRSVKTVSAQKVSAMRKLEVSNDHELIMFCAAHSVFT